MECLKIQIWQNKYDYYYLDLKISGSHEYPTIVSTEIFDCFLREPFTEICLKVNSRWCFGVMCIGSLILISSYQIGFVL